MALGWAAVKELNLLAVIWVHSKLNPVGPTISLISSLDHNTPTQSARLDVICHYGKATGECNADRVVWSRL